MLVNIRKLQPPANVFRPVDVDGLDMALMVDSLKTNGLLVPLTICSDVIVDGYRRWLAAKAIGWEQVECHVVGGDPAQLRIIAQTRNTEFGRNEKRAFIGRYVAENRDVTAGEIAHTFKWSPVEVEDLVGVNFLIPELEVAYSDGRIKLSDVWHCSKVRDTGQVELWEQGPDELFDRAQAMHREERSQRRRSMVSRPRAKGYNALVAERDNPREAGLCLIKANAKTPMDGWKACMEWVLGKDSR